MIVLKAKDLMDKFGFGDGLLFSDLLEDAGFDTEASRPVEHDVWEGQAFDHAVLAEVVRERLLPRLVGYELDTCCSLSHNPVRLVVPEGGDEAVVRQSLEDVTVEVSEEEVLEMARRMAPEFKADGARDAVVPG